MLADSFFPISPSLYLVQSSSKVFSVYITSQMQSLSPGPACLSMADHMSPFTADLCYVALMPGLEKSCSVMYFWLLQGTKADQIKEDCLFFFFFPTDLSRRSENHQQSQTCGNGHSPLLTIQQELTYLLAVISSDKQISPEKLSVFVS